MWMLSLLTGINLSLTFSLPSIWLVGYYRKSEWTKQQHRVYSPKGPVRLGGQWWREWFYNPTDDNASIKRQLDITRRANRDTSTIPKDGFDYLLALRRLYNKWNLSNTTIDLIIDSWREGTKSQYKLYFNKWCLYCERRKINPFQPTIIEAVEVLVVCRKFYSIASSTSD